MLSHTYALTITNNRSFLTAPSTIAKQQFLFVRVRIVCTKCFCCHSFGLDELLPWDTISDGVSTGCLLRERERAYRSETTPDCRTACNGCGANRLLKGGRCDA